MPSPIVRWLARRYPDVLWAVETAEPVVALTVNDGPEAGTTGGVLDALASGGARATFFCIGRRVAGNEALLARAVREGHELANHSWEHGPSVALGARAFEASLLATERVLAPFGGRRWFRPGSGFFSAPMLATARRHGYRCVLGSVYPFDPHVRSRHVIAAYLRRAVHPGAIVVLHDSGGRGPRTAAVLRTVLPELAGRGYRVVTLTELVRAGTA